MAAKGRNGKAVTRRGAWPTKFIAALSRCGNVRAACLSAGIGRDTAYTRRHNNPAFAAKWETALDEAVEVLEAEALRRATRGIPRLKFTKNGSVIKKPGTDEPYVEYHYSDQLLMLLLRAARPDKYRDNFKIEHAGKVDHDHEHKLVNQLLEDPEAVALANALERRLALNAGRDGQPTN